jgi:hypothetical protein
MTVSGPGYSFETPLMNTSTSLYASGYIYGDNPLSVIRTNNETGRSLLVFKESFGNALVPYMTDYYDTVVVVDIRTAPDSIRSLIDTYGLTDALIVNNAMASSSLTSYLGDALSR